ncbi:MAG: hypothetical protein ABI273_03800 [Lacunisphaera sp.]
MKSLQITLFLIANVIFITQAGRDVHQLFFGTQSSVLDQFSPETEKARAEKEMTTMITEYRVIDEEVRSLEKGKKYAEVADLRQERSALYDRRDALASEITERERKGRELRDLGIFSAFAVALICIGIALYRASITWPGFAILVTGFSILEYWSSPTFFGGAVAEFHSLLVAKTILTLAALILLYLFWRIKEMPSCEAMPDRAVT